MDKINFQNTVHRATAGQINQCPQDGKPEVVLAGRSNVGKSTLINALTNKKKIARVSQSPGKTRLILYFEVDNTFYLTDLPGYGYAKASQAEIAKFNTLADDYLNSGRNIKLILFLIDIRRGPQEDDLALFEWLNHNKISYLLVFSKADKLSKSQINNSVFKWQKEGKLQEGIPYIALSSTRKIGIESLQEYINQIIIERNELS